MSNILICEQKTNTENEQKTNKKRTENNTSINCEFVGFAKNEQKKEKHKKFKEILIQHPELYDLIQENERLEKENENLIDENISLGEQIEAYKIKVGDTSINSLKEQIRVLANEKLVLQQKYNNAVQTNNDNVDKFNLIQEKCLKLQKENNIYKTKRGLLSIAQDKARINYLHNENKELKRKVEHVGRLPITDAQISSIIELYNAGFSQSNIVSRTKLAKSTVSKYVCRYLNGKIK